MMEINPVHLEYVHHGRIQRETKAGGEEVLEDNNFVILGVGINFRCKWNPHSTTGVHRGAQWSFLLDSPREEMHHSVSQFPYNFHSLFPNKRNNE